MPNAIKNYNFKDIECRNLRILERGSETCDFVSDIQYWADLNKDALGFLPSKVYEEYVRLENFFVLISDRDGIKEYVGHLMFRCSFPKAHIVQIFIKPSYRKLGLAKRLVDHLKYFLAKQNFISIYARVANDLVESNNFWELQKFYVQNITNGGKTRKRKIHTRVNELDSPQLFPSSGLTQSNPLGIQVSQKQKQPLFLIDLNVLFDVGPRRARHKEMAGLFQAERLNFCKLAISDEIKNELKRHSDKGKTDPMSSYASLFITFPLGDDDESKSLVNELAPIIFPEKHNNGKLSSNDISDIKHVATCIHKNLAGFITNDGAILSSAEKIKRKYGIEILSPSAFLLNEESIADDAIFLDHEGATLEISRIESDQTGDTHSLLTQLGANQENFFNGWLSSGDDNNAIVQYGIYSAQKLIGYVSWNKRQDLGITFIRAAIDESYDVSYSAARLILNQVISHHSTSITKLSLELLKNQSILRELAISSGFYKSTDSHNLDKICLGQIVVKGNWDAVKALLENSADLRLPVHMPKMDDALIPIFTPDGNQKYVSVETLETSLSPAIFCLPGRCALLTPVQKKFADHLIGNTRQGSLLPSESVSIFQERHYISTHKNIEKFVPGNLILFYETSKKNGSAAVIAIARVRNAYLKSIVDIDKTDLQPSVFNQGNINILGNTQLKTITVFDNLLPFEKTVPLEVLKEIGCGSPIDLITTNKLTDEQLQEILKRAF